MCEYSNIKLPQKNLAYLKSVYLCITYLYICFADTPYTKIYFSTDGTKPNPFQIGVAGRESTFKYKAPFQLKEGRRTIKAVAISR